MSDHENGGDNRRIYYGVAIGILMVRTYFHPLPWGHWERGYLGIPGELQDRR